MARRGPEDESTIPPRAVAEPSSALPAPWLTVAWHPELVRSGDVAALRGRFSRLEPEFAAPGAPARAPLGDPHVSRTPIGLAALAGGGVQLTAQAQAELIVDGMPIAGDHVVDAARLAHGVVL